MRIENIEISGIDTAVKASKYPMSVDIEKVTEEITPTVEHLAKAKMGSGHDNFLNGITISFDVFGTNKWWTEMQRYHFIDFVSSQSTLHRIIKFNLDKAYNVNVDARIIEIMKEKVAKYTKLEKQYKDLKKRFEALTKIDNIDKNELAIIKDQLLQFNEYLKTLYLEILYSNPAGFILGARLVTNYRQLKTIYAQRKNHRLPEWREFCSWIETLPHSDWMTENA